MVRIFIFLLLGSCTSISGVLRKASQKRELNILVIDSGVSYKYDSINRHLTTFNPEVVDTHGHGTHVTSAILQDSCPEVKITPCKYFYPKNEEKTGAEYKKCLDKMVSGKYDIINISGGGYQFVDYEYQQLRKLLKSKTLVVAAAGNDGKYLPLNPFYPASHKLHNIIAVGALGPMGRPSYTSNWDLNIRWEPGEDILAHGLNGLETKSGTSMAAAKFTNRLVRKFCEGLK